MDVAYAKSELSGSSGKKGVGFRCRVFLGGKVTPNSAVNLWILWVPGGTIMRNYIRVFCGKLWNQKLKPLSVRTVTRGYL